MAANELYKSSSRVASRDTLSAPNKVIQVERVHVSEYQKSSVTSAIRTGKAEKSD
jgi:hypothetical protein